MSQYIIDLIMNNEVIFHNWVVMDSEIGKQGIDVLIGNIGIITFVGGNFKRFLIFKIIYLCIKAAIS